MANYDQVRDGDRSTISHQLGRSPRNLVGIAVRCSAGEPQVVVNHPLIFHGEFPEIFPTLYWLTCPRLVKEISRLEGAGAIEEIQEDVFNDPELAERLYESYETYARQRVDLVKDSVLKSIKERYPAQYSVLHDSGVGGIMDQGIKCLHTHVADFMVNGINPVGQLTIERLGERYNELCSECKTECE